MTQPTIKIHTLKLLTALTFIATPATAQIDTEMLPKWSTVWASSFCYYLEQGNTPRESANLSANEMTKSSYNEVLTKEHEQGTIEKTLKKAFLHACPNKIKEAKQKYGNINTNKGRQ